MRETKMESSFSYATLTDKVEESSALCMKLHALMLWSHTDSGVDAPIDMSVPAALIWISHDYPQASTVLAAMIAEIRTDLDALIPY